jgi:integrase
LAIWNTSRLHFKRKFRCKRVARDDSQTAYLIDAGLEDVLDRPPDQGRLFPDLNVNLVTKRFAEARSKLGLERPGLVFHSTRKWFITQCERTGVPEHFTASLVGHQSARSENQLTYSIYSTDISDEQKRSIVDQLRLPT